MTLKQLTTRIQRKGYRVSERTIKYYSEIGLIPKSTGCCPKCGEQIDLHFSNSRFTEESFKVLVKIFELKGRGYKLKEIKEEVAS